MPQSSGVQSSPLQRPLAMIMNRRIRTIAAAASLNEAARCMRDEKCGALLVREQEAYVGIVSETDLVRKAMAGGLDPTREAVRAVMSAPIITIEIDRTSHDASDLMAEKNIRHLAVTQDGTIVGTLSVRDLLRYFKNWGTF